MIYLITGLPGSYKTTWTLRELCGSGFADRRKFAHGVNGLKVPDIENVQADSVRNWRALPAGSVILVDEAQKLFPARGMHSGAPPKWIEDLAEHRHDGYDFMLLTQHPTFVDPFVRKLVGRHVHLARRFGMTRATVFSWEETAEPGSSAAQATALKSTFVPVEADYLRHESATQHTHKRRLPWKKILLLVGALVLVALCATFVVRHLTSGLGVKAVPASAAGANPPAAGGSARHLVRGAWSSLKRSSRAEYADRPESAPLFDQLQEVKSQPRVVGCMDLGVSLGGKPSCFCTTVQGSIIREVSVHACRSLIRSGWFDETKKPVDVGELQIARLNALDGGKEGGAKSAEGAGPQGPPPAEGVLPEAADTL